MTYPLRKSPNPSCPICKGKGERPFECCLGEMTDCECTVMKPSEFIDDKVKKATVPGAFSATQRLCEEIIAIKEYLDQFPPRNLPYDQ